MTQLTLALMQRKIKVYSCNHRAHLLFTKLSITGGILTERETATYFL
jgi:hypothetical protein